VICKLDMPLMDPSLRGGRIVSWSKSVGDEITFGDELCVVVLDDFATLRRTATATLLAGRRRGKLKNDQETREGKVLLQVAITSSDSGVLPKIIKDQGDDVAMGDTMAIVTAQESDDLGGESDWAQAPALRVVANTVPDDLHFEELS